MGKSSYDVLNTDTIMSFDVASIADKTSMLFLWATYPMIKHALSVMDAWGFEYKTVAFTWVKNNRSGVGFHFGLGYWTRANPEICLLGIRGKPHRINADIPNLLISPLREHSRKPDEARDRIIRLCGDLPRIELFARRKVEGWDCWGNEVDSDIELRWVSD